MIGLVNQCWDNVGGGAYILFHNIQRFFRA